jgi:uncharacterized protein (TIGR03083 family)
MGDADWELVHAERRALVELFRGIEGEQWQVASLCPGWTVHDVLAHLAGALDVGTAESLKLLVASLGRPKVLIDKLTRAYAPRSDADLLATFEKHVDSAFAPVGMSWKAPLTDVMVHRMDIAVPLDIDPQRPPESWRPVLEFLTSGTPMMGTIRGGRPGLTYRATDLDWSSGSGPEVTGTAAELGLTLSGRAALVDRLSGPGRESLATWVG